MRISKIIAGMSAMAIASVMAVTANANSIAPTDEAAASKEWISTFAEGDYVAGSSFDPNSDCEVTVNFEWTDKGSEASFCAFKPAFANGWESLFLANPDYISGWPLKNDLETNDEEQLIDENGDLVPYAIQDDDGWFQIYDTSVTSVTFTMSAACLADMQDNVYYGNGAATTNDDGTTTDWDGFLIQTGNNGINITSIDFSQDVKLQSEVAAEAPARRNDVPRIFTASSVRRA